MRKVQVLVVLLIYAFGGWSASAKLYSRMYYRRAPVRRIQRQPQRPPKTNAAQNAATATPPPTVPPPQPVVAPAYVRPPVTTNLALIHPRPAPVVKPPPRDPSQRPQSVIEMRYENPDPLLEFQRANAAKGFPESQYAMGMRYLSGIGVPQDEAKAREYLQAAASKGNQQAKEKLRDLQRTEKAAPLPSTDPAAALQAQNTP